MRGVTNCYAQTVIQFKILGIPNWILCTVRPWRCNELFLVVHSTPIGVISVRGSSRLAKFFFAKCAGRVEFYYSSRYEQFVPVIAPS